MEIAMEEKEGKFLLNIDALEAAIREGTIAAIKEEVKSVVETERKNIFSENEANRSEVDERYFTKRYDNLEDKDFAMNLARGSGPWKKLSPAMQRFAEGCKMGFDPNKMASTGMNIQDYNKEIREWNTKAASDALTTTDAGALVPIEFMATVIEFATAQSKILPLLWRIPMSSLTMRIPTLSQAAGSYFGGIVLYHPEEAAIKTETKPTFSYKTFTAKKLIGIIPLTDEVIADSAINLINYMTGLFVRAFQYKIEGEVVSGSGNAGQMLGIINEPSINFVNRVTTATVKFNDLINLDSAIDDNFQNLTWMTRKLTANTLRKEKDTVGQPVYNYGWPPGSTGPQILEYPVIKTRNCPALGSKGDIILGDLGYYIWALRQDMTIDMSKDAYFFYDETVLRFVMRMDGAPGVPIAFATLRAAIES
jgi:HK97 family phage major capsid protein